MPRVRDIYLFWIILEINLAKYPIKIVGFQIPSSQEAKLQNNSGQSIWYTSLSYIKVSCVSFSTGTALFLVKKPYHVLPF